MILCDIIGFTNNSIIVVKNFTSYYGDDVGNGKQSISSITFSDTSLTISPIKTHIIAKLKNIIGVF